MKPFLLILAVFVIYARCEIKEEESGECASDKLSCVNRRKSVGRYEQVRKRVERVRQACGQVCNTTIKGVPGKYFEAIEKEIDCDALFASEDMDASSEFDTPPAKMPKWLMDDYTYQNRVATAENYYDDSDGNGHTLIWSRDFIQFHLDKLTDGTLQGSYGRHELLNIQRHLKEHMKIRGKHVLVIGSQKPWLESLLISLGVGKITTLEYMEIKSEVDLIETILPRQLAERWLKAETPAERPQYDAVVTFSSVEHSGLGRYGDALNPWGDLIAMARAHCLTKPGGLALVGVPTAPGDAVVWNGAKLYGNLMLAHLFANWKQIYTENDLINWTDTCPYCYQPLFVVEKKKKSSK